MDTAKLSEFIKKRCLLTAGDKESFNSMTIGWGSFGRLWNKPVCTVFVRPSRYTYDFMEKNDYFTVQFLKDGNGEALKVMGTVSGRDEDKVKLTGLTPVFLDKGVTYKEAYLTVVCRKIFFQDMDPKCIAPEDLKDFYSGEDEGNFHRVYVGVIEDIIVA